MNNKKITAGLLALTFVFGGATVPDMAVNSSTVISASAERTEEFRYGDSTSNSSSYSTRSLSG